MPRQDEPARVSDLEIAAARQVLARARTVLARIEAREGDLAELAALAEDLARRVAAHRRGRAGSIAPGAAPDPPIDERRGR
jgi:hypothetical protein